MRPLFVSRFDWAVRGWAWLVLALLCLSVVASVLTPPIKEPPPEIQTHAVLKDPMLYKQIAERVGRGESYYHVAAELHRYGGFPLRPFITVRLPTLAFLSGYLGPNLTFALFLGLVGAVLISWWLVLKQLMPDRTTAIASWTLIAISCFVLINPITILYHETWAALLIALALALWQMQRLWPAIIAAVIAALIRELASPFLLLMCVAALWDRRWREAGYWLGGMAVVAIALKFHADAVAQIVQPGDLASPGWHSRNGWPLLVLATQFGTPLILAPRWLTLLLLPFALFGWASWKHPLALRVSGLIFGFGMMVMLFARVQNFYWMLLTVPLLLAGLALALQAITRLATAARAPH